jgi:hypothetical protein
MSPQTAALATGALSQQPQPSATEKLGLIGGYLSLVDPLASSPLESSGALGTPADSTWTNFQPATSERIVEPVIPLPRRVGRLHLKPIQTWEGVVEAIDDTRLVARLYDRRGSGRPEEAEFPLSDVADGDRGLVVRGAVFYWTIGYLTSSGGQRTRTSTIRFRRLPVWTDDELQAAESRALETQRLLGWA